MIHSFNDIILKVGQRKTYASDFSAGVASSDGWGNAGGGLNYPSSIDGESDAMFMNGDGVERVHYAQSPTIFSIAKRYRVTGKVYVRPQATGSLLGGVYVYDGLGHELQVITTLNSWTNFDIEFPPSHGHLSRTVRLIARHIGGGTTVTMTTSDEIYFKDIVVTELSDAAPGEIYATSADINSDLQLGGRNNVSHTQSSEYFSGGPSRGQININYFLTGQDPLTELVDSSSPTIIDLGGFSVNSGYLTRYDVKFSQYNPISVSATFDFFEKVRGSFTEETSSLPSDNYFLNSADLVLSDERVISADHLRSLSYTYSTSVAPHVEIDHAGGWEDGDPEDDLDEVPAKGVVFNIKKIDVSAETYNYDLDLPASGLLAGVKINLNDQHGNKKLEFEVNGVIRSKSLSANVGSEIFQKIDIAQGNLGGERAVIYPFAAGSVGGAHTGPSNWPNVYDGKPGDNVFIYSPDHSDTFKHVDSVSFMGFSCDILSKGRTADILAPSSSEYIEISLPYNVPNSGKAPFVVGGPAGESVTPTTVEIAGAGTSDLF